jgi:hypothetical protein
MNRFRPPMPPPVVPPAYRPGPAPQQPAPGPRRGPENPYAPAHVLIGLIRQSENRYVTYRDLAMKQDRGFGQLQIDAQNLSIALSPRDPEAYGRIQTYLDAALAAAENNKRLLEEAMQHEIALQGELKRWLSGLPASPLPTRNPWPTEQGNGTAAQEQATQSTQQPQQQAQQQPQQQPQQQQSSTPQYFKGQTEQAFAPGDLRDPKQAQEFLGRAEQMPVANAMGQPPAPGQPVYQTQNGPGGYAQPPGVPVSMHYADAQQSQASAPVQFASAEATQAAIAEAHRTNQPIGSNGAPHGAQNGAAK